MGPAEFAKMIRTQLATRGYDRYVSVEFDGERIAVELKWMGTTRFRYRVTPVEDGFRADLVDQRVSPFHAVFSDRFEGYFEEALNNVGAKVV